MADLAVGISKSAVQSLADKVRSAIREEADKWQIVQRDLVFIKGEFEMMQAFLDIGNAQHVKNSVGRTWVRQVHDLSYDTEDWMEFVLHLEPRRSGWLRRMLPSCMEAATQPLDVAVDEIEHLKARVEDVSQRKYRYSLIGDNGSNPIAEMEQTLHDSTRALDVFVKARDDEKDRAAVTELKSLITTADRGLKVVSVCGIGGDLGTTSIIRQVYEDSEICSEFKLRAWLKLVQDSFGFRLVFFRDLTSQFVANKKRNVPIKEVIGHCEMDDDEIGDKLDRLLKKGRFLIVLEDLSSMAMWDYFRMHLPEKKNGSRIIVLTKTLEMASLCTGRPYKVSTIREFSADRSVCIFFKEASLEDSQETECDRVDSWSSGSDSDGSSEIATEDRAMELLCRTAEKCRNGKGSVIFFWGNTGVNNSEFVSHVYNRIHLDSTFQRYAWVNNGPRPSAEGYLLQLLSKLCPDREITDSLSKECQKVLRESCCLVVLNLISRFNWEFLKDDLVFESSKSCIVVISEDEGAHAFARMVRQEGNAHLMRVPGVQSKQETKEDPVNRRSNRARDLSLLQSDPMWNRRSNRARDLSLLQSDPLWGEDFRLHGRDSEVKKLENLITPYKPRVLSVYGLPGVGKRALVRTVYNRCKARRMFVKYAWINVPSKDEELDINEFCRDLYIAFCPKESKGEYLQLCGTVLRDNRCLVVIDGLESESHWNSINSSLTASMRQSFPGQKNCIIVICSNISIAKHCAPENQLHVDRLDADAVIDLLNSEEKSGTFQSTSVGLNNHMLASTVRGEAAPNSHCDMTVEASLQISEMTEEGSLKRAEAIRKECGRFIEVAYGLHSYLAGKQDVSMEMDRLKANIMQELENKKLDGLRRALTEMHRSLKDSTQVHMKCIFYLSIFRESSRIRRSRLVRRWIAEGYSKGSESSSMVYYTEKLFQKLAELGIIDQPLHTVSGLTDDLMTSCRVISLFLEYIMSREKKEKIFVPLEVIVLQGDCCLDTDRVGQHLVIPSSWNRNEIELENLDLSRLRSLTMSGEWWPCLIVSGRMRVLRVLDLENSSNIEYGHLKKIVEFLPRLKFLSLRGCKDITRLPSSLGDLVFLQTLDIRQTSVFKLPKSIIKLRRLQYIRAGTLTWDYTGPDVSESGQERNLPIPPVQEAAIPPSTVEDTKAVSSEAEQQKSGATEEEELSPPSCGTASAVVVEEKTPPAVVTEREQTPPAPSVEKKLQASSSNSEPTVSRICPTINSSEAEQQKPGATEEEELSPPSRSTTSTVVVEEKTPPTVVTEREQTPPAPSVEKKLQVLSSNSEPTVSRTYPTINSSETEQQKPGATAEEGLSPPSRSTTSAVVVEEKTPLAVETKREQTPLAPSEEKNLQASSSNSEVELPMQLTVSRTCPMVYSWFSKSRPRRPVGACPPAGLVVPAGIAKLTALHTLGVVNVNTASGKAIVEGLGKHTQLRKLGLCGIDRGNSRHLPLPPNLESLSLHFQEDKRHKFPDCWRAKSLSVSTDDIQLPRKLRSLKLYGHVDNMPPSINGLQSLIKLSLEMITLKQEDIEALGKLDNLHALRLRVNNVPNGGLRFDDRIVNDDRSISKLFCTLQVLDIQVVDIQLLDIASTNRSDVTFNKGALEMLRLLEVRSPPVKLLVLGLKKLNSLKQVSLIGSYTDALKEELQNQLDGHRNKVRLKTETSN